MFDDLAARGMFLEWAHVYRYRYGTSREWVEQRLSEGWDVIMDVDVQGAEQIRRCGFPSHSIFLLPPSWEVLCYRLASRATDSPEELEVRLRWARKELSAWKASQYVIVNEDLNEAVRAMESVVMAQRYRTQRRRPWIEQHLLRWTPPSE
jgi:guanylate kinase